MLKKKTDTAVKHSKGKGFAWKEINSCSGDQDTTAACQSRFRKRRGSLDPVICLEDEVRKVQIKVGASDKATCNGKWR